MTGWADEADAAQELAIGAVNRLLEIDPTNELLWFMTVPPEGVKDPFDGDEEKARIAMKDRFWNREKQWQGQPGSIVTTVVLANYFVAVEDKIRELSAGKEGNLTRPSSSSKER